MAIEDKVWSVPGVGAVRALVRTAIPPLVTARALLEARDAVTGEPITGERLEAVRSAVNASA